MMKLKTTLIGLACLLAVYTRGNPKDSVRCGTWLTANFHYGFIIPAYNSSMLYLLKGHCPGAEFDWLLKSTPDRQWVCTYHYPEMGVAFFFSSLGNPTELGNMYGVYPFINFHLNRNCRERFYLRVGIGLGYIPINFNQQTNHKDELIGSHLNAMINFRLTKHFYLSDKIRLELGLGATHCSDGTFKTPNLGINLATANTGLSYCINNNKMLPATFDNDTSFHKGFSHEFFLAGGLSEVEPPGGPKYGAGTLMYTFYRVKNKKNRLGLGTDVFYNQTNIVHMDGYNVNIAPLQNIQLGLKAAYELTVGKVAMPIEFGGYLYSKSTYSGWEYNRIGLRYYATRHFIVSLTLLAHFATADYIEWGFGYRL